jgi:hypothetical protein
VSRDFRDLVANVSNSLDIEPIPTILNPVEIVPIDNDHQFARENIHKVVQQTSRAVEQLSQLAVLSQDPEHFDALSKLVQTMVNASEQLIKLNEVQQKIKVRENGDVGAKTINNNLYLTTADLQKMIQQHKSGDDGED